MAVSESQQARQARHGRVMELNEQQLIGSAAGSSRRLEELLASVAIDLARIADALEHMADALDVIADRRTPL